MSKYVAEAKMDWLTWLHRIAPDCPYTSADLEQLSKEFPDLEVERNFSFEVPRSRWERIERQSPWTVDQLLSRPAIEWLPSLIEFRGDDLFEPSDRGLAEAVEAAATQDFGWGIELADALIDGEHWDAKLWDAILRTWEADMEEQQYRQVLLRLGNPNLSASQTQPVCRVLAKLVSQGGRSYAPALLPSANELAGSLWPHVAQDDRIVGEMDWHTLAINHAAGPLAEFWMGSLSIGLNEQQIVRGELPGDYRAALDTIVEDTTPAGVMARATLMTRFAFLFYVDEAWTRQHLVPFLINDPESDNYQAAWDGLMYGQLTIPTIEALTDPFLSAAARASGFSDHHTRERFIDWLVAVLIDFIDDPIDEWLPALLLNAGEDERQRFAWAIWKRLGGMSDSEQQELWNRWLKRYWENRIDGVPLPLNDAETEWMFSWLPQLHSLFAEGVELALRMPSENAKAFFLIRRLEKGDHWEREPNATTDLLLHVATSKSGVPPYFRWGELIERLMQSDLTEDRKQSLEELRVRFGPESG